MIRFIFFVFVLVHSRILQDSKAESRYRIKPYHRVYAVDFASSVVVSLPEEIKGVRLLGNITELPSFGFIYQVTQVFNDHGYEPVFLRSVENSKVLENDTVIYSRKNIVVYALPEEYEFHLNPKDLARGNFAYYGRLRYTLMYDTESVRQNIFTLRDMGISPRFLTNQRAEGQILFVNAEKIFFRSLFTFSNEGWQVINNNLCNGDNAFTDYYVSDRRGESFIEPYEVYDDAYYFEFDKEEHNYDGVIKVLQKNVYNNPACSPATSGRVGHENSQLMDLSRFIYGSEHEKQFNIDESCETELARWYFKAPSNKYSDDWSVLYGGTIEFVLGTLGGDFSDRANYNKDLNVIILECQYCNTDLKRMAYRIQPSENHSIMHSFLKSDFSTFKVNVELTEEDEKWILYPLNPVQQPRRPTKCEFANFLGGISDFYVLGDYLVGYETLGLDEVIIRVGTIGPQSGPPEECYCKIPGIGCDTETIFYIDTTAPDQ